MWRYWNPHVFLVEMENGTAVMENRFLKKLNTELSSVQFSRSVVSDSLRPHGLQHARPLRPSPTPGVYSNSCPLSQWCHPTISFSVILFSSHLQSFPASGSFQMSQLFASGGQSIRVSASASILPVNTQDWSPCNSRDSQESSPTPQFKSINSSVLSFLYNPILSYVPEVVLRHLFRNAHCSIIHSGQKMEIVQCSSVDDWITKIWYICIVEYYSVFKMNEVVLHSTSQIDKLWIHYVK